MAMNTSLRKESSGLGKTGQRILSLWFPYLPVERIRRQRQGRSWRSDKAAFRRPEPPAMVVSHRRNNAQRLAALDERAEALGLKRGMGLADARAMHPSIDVVEADPAADRRLLEALADWCDRYTPLVALDGADGLFLDITGCAHLFGGERPLLKALLTTFFQQGLDARAGIASTAGAAWAAARFGGAEVVPAGQEHGFLSPLPLAALRLEAATRTSLEGVGLRSVGALTAAPRAPLARRFGAAVLLRLDQALGDRDETISPSLRVPPLSAERPLAEPVTLTDDIEALAGMLAHSLRQDLERRGEGARRLSLLLFRVDGAVARIEVGTSRPLRDPGPIRALFRERLAAMGDMIDAGCGFDLVRLCVLATDRLEASQADLTGPAEADDTGLAAFVDRVCARLGEAALSKPVAVESHVPERAVAMRPFAGSDLPRRIPPSRPAHDPPRRNFPPQRPIRLFDPPEPVEVAATEMPEGPPMRFRWRHAMHTVSCAEGPERIAPEWWRDQEPTRDYFRIEDEEGRRYWLYRQGLYAAGLSSPRWFMHGLFP